MRRPALAMVISLAAMLAAVGACTPDVDYSGVGVDARGTAPPPPPPPDCNSYPGPQPTCDTTCGNDQIDMCWDFTSSPMNGCRQWYPRRDACDGTAKPTCVELGYYGGESVCTSCRIVAAGCDACSSAPTSCLSLGAFSLADDRTVVPSGTHVALLTPAAVIVVDGDGSISQVDIQLSDAIAAVPGGWLVAHGDPVQLTPLSTGGVRGTTQLIGAVNTHGMAATASGAVLVVGYHDVGADRVLRGFIADATGSTVVAPFDLFTSPSRVSVTSDGTNFFVGGGGQLARIQPDGTRRVVSGFPLDELEPGKPVRVTWSGTTGWYVMSSWWASDRAIQVQRFDASGDPVGAAFTLALQADHASFVADGDHLVGVHSVEMPGSLRRLMRVNIDGAGTVGAATELGVGDRALEVVRADNDLVVVWNSGAALRLARVAP